MSALRTVRRDICKHFTGSPDFNKSMTARMQAKVSENALPENEDRAFNKKVDKELMKETNFPYDEIEFAEND